MVLANVVGGTDGVTFASGWTDQSNLSTALESYSNSSSVLFNAPSNNGYVAWSLIPEDAIATTNHAASTHLQLTRVYVPASGSVGHIDLDFTTSGTVTVLYAGVYTAAGALISGLSTAESHASIVTNALTSLAFTTATVLAPGNYYVGTTMTWSVQPVLAGSTIGGGAGTTWMTNANLTVSTANSADAGVNATLPSSITMSSNTLLANKIWAGLRA